MPLSDWPVAFLCVCVGRCFLISDCCGSAQPTVGIVITGQVVLGCLGSQAEQAIKGKSVGSVLSRCLLEVLHRLSSGTDCDRKHEANKPFPP